MKLRIKIVLVLMMSASFINGAIANTEANARRRKSPQHVGASSGWAQDRVVFRAKSDTAEVRFTDWAMAENSRGSIVEETVLAYVICRPYYVESEDELREIITHWPENRK